VIAIPELGEIPASAALSAAGVAVVQVAPSSVERAIAAPPGPPGEDGTAPRTVNQRPRHMDSSRFH